MVFPHAISCFFSLCYIEFFLGLVFFVPFDCVKSEHVTAILLSHTKALSLLIITSRLLIAHQHLLLSFSSENTGYNTLSYAIFSFFLSLKCVLATKNCGCFGISDLAIYPHTLRICFSLASTI